MAYAFGKVAVLMGGTSAEREVSLRSGAAVLAALRAEGVDAVGIDPRDGLLRQLEAEAVERVFIALHGRGGEDGSIQGFLETLGLPYTGSGVSASALAMNKQFTKHVWRGVGLPTPEARLLDAKTDWEATEQDLGLPIMIKPTHEGSSVGITKVTQPGCLQAAWREASRYDTQVLAERFICGREYTASIVADRVFPLVHLETPRDFYDYTAKYHDVGTHYHCPCGLDSEQEQRLQDLCMQAFHAVEGRGWGRVDLMLDNDHQPWLLEVNTAPGMTDHSLVPMAARAAGLSFGQLVIAILAAV